ncbi:MAG: YqiA/YcfP family alpha/beta fold hydrolase [Nitrosopumilaceae archaeon]
MHGFKGKCPNKFTRALEKYFPKENVFGLNYVFDPIEAEKALAEEIKEKIAEHFDDINIVFAGHSLGGFWAYYFAHKHPTSRAILINPLINPFESKAGTYYSGNHGKIIITQQQITDCKKYDVLGVSDKKVPTLLLFDLGDKKIPHENTFSLFAEKDTDVFCFEGGSHRFTHLKQAMPVVKWFYHKDK